MKTLRRMILIILTAGMMFGVVPAMSRPVQAYTVYNTTKIGSLNSRQRSVLTKIMNYVKSGRQTKVTLQFSSVSPSEFQKLWAAINDNCFRYYSEIHMNAWTYRYTRTGAYAYTKIELYAKDSKKRYNRSLANRAKLRKLAKSITRGKSTTKKKVLAINNYVINKLTWRDNKGTLDVALRTRYAKCTGYACLFMGLCEQLNIPCCLVAGDAGGGHCWNKVKISKTWFYIDPTWNDTTWNRNSYSLRKSLWRDHTKWSEIYFLYFKHAGYTSEDFA